MYLNQNTKLVENPIHIYYLLLHYNYIYQVNYSSGRVAGRLSVASKDSDSFEKSYQTIIQNAPKLQKYAETTSADDLKKQKKKAYWIIGGLTALCSAVPIYLTRNLEGKRVLAKQCLATLAGAAVGLSAGVFAAKKISTPPGAVELNEASKVLASLDIERLS